MVTEEYSNSRATVPVRRATTGYAPRKKAKQHCTAAFEVYSYLAQSSCAKKTPVSGGDRSDVRFK